MTQPDPDDGNVDITARVLADLNSDPISRAFLERAQYRVTAQVQQEQITARDARIAELEQQHSPATRDCPAPQPGAGPT